KGAAPMTPPVKNDRPGVWMMFVLCAVVIFGAICAWLVGGMWLSFLYRLITDGGIAVIWLLAAVGMGRSSLESTRIRCDSKSLMFATAGAVGLGVMSIAILLLGLMGWMNRPVAMGLVAIGLICGVIVEIRKNSNQKIVFPEFKPAYWIWLI